LQIRDYFNKHIAEKEIIMESDEITPDNKNIIINMLLWSKINKDCEQPLSIVYCTKSSIVWDLIGKPKVSNNKDDIFNSLTRWSINKIERVNF